MLKYKAQEMMMNKNFNKCVNEAKKVVALLRLKNIHRLKVAELALKACTIKHGGRVKEDRETLKAFCEKIGVHYHTVYEWVRYKKLVYDKLEPDNKKIYEEMSADVIKHVCVGLSDKTTKPRVNRKFKSFAKRGPIETKLNKYSKVLDTIIYNVSAFIRSQEIPDELLKGYIRKCRTIITYCEKILETRNGNKKIQVKAPAIKWDDFWNEEVGVQ